MRPHCDSCEYIIDIYFQGDLTHLWTKTVEGDTKHYPLWYHPRIYIASDTDYDVTGRLKNQNRGLIEIAREVATLDWVFSIRVVSRLLDNFAEEATKVLEVRLRSYKDFDTRISQLLRDAHYNVFNCDINRRQHFFIEEEISPMCAVHLNADLFRSPFLREKKSDFLYLSDESLPKLEEMEPWEQDHGKEPLNLVKAVQYDDISEILYFLPPVRVLTIKFEIDMAGFFPVKHDRIRSLQLELNTMYQPEQQTSVESETRIISGSEDKIIRDLQTVIDTYDPDVLDISNGDKFYLNYLTYRAEQVGYPLKLDRLDRTYYRRDGKESQAQTYMTYGQIMRREPVKYLAGRLHIDIENSFFLAESGLAGMFDLSRISGVPPIRSSRASIGGVLTGVEFKINHATAPPTLVPPNKSRGEQFKTAEQLLIADNGGLIFPAAPGVHDRVWAVDFTSLYPFIMSNHNISNETVLCEHETCQGETAVRIPETEYHVCQRRIGVVTRTMALVLGKRVQMKMMKRRLPPSPIREKISGIDSAYKWILVSSFGYLGFKNARWGSIESHQCVTAYGREMLRQAMQLAHEFGYETIAGITDSLFIRAIKPEDDTRERLDQFIHATTRKIGVPLDVEGKFRWIVFGSIKEYNNVAALNRYFGYFDHGEFKLRGIRHRQRRVTPFERSFQEELLALFKEASCKQEYFDLLPQSYDILQDHIEQLRSGMVDTRHLMMKLKSTRGGDGYRAHSTVQAVSTKRYASIGQKVFPGQNFFFVVVDDTTKKDSIERVRVGPEITSDTKYDPEYYVKLIEADYFEITYDAQIQAFGSVKYSATGVERSLDDWDQFGDEYDRQQEVQKSQNNSDKIKVQSELKDFF